VIPKAKIEEWKARVDKQRAGRNWDPDEWDFWGEPIAALLSERESLLAMLRECADPRPNVIGGIGVLVASGCPLCAGSRGEHRPDCRLAAFLREAP
jgi:hypothetical protein